MSVNYFNFWIFILGYKSEYKGEFLLVVFGVPNFKYILVRTSLYPETIARFIFLPAIAIFSLFGVFLLQF